jgi:hypothetical protein
VGFYQQKLRFYQRKKKKHGFAGQKTLGFNQLHRDDSTRNGIKIQPTNMLLGVFANKWQSMIHQNDDL